MVAASVKVSVLKALIVTLALSFVLQVISDASAHHVALSCISGKPCRSPSIICLFFVVKKSFKTVTLQI